MMLDTASEQRLHEIARPTAISFDGIAALILAVFVGLVPFFFIPSETFPLLLTKVAFIALAALLGLACFIVARMKERSLSLPKTPLFFAVFALPIAYVLSSAFSSNVGLALGGATLAIDSAAFIALLSLLLIIPALVVRTKTQILQFYVALLAGGIVLGVFQGIRLFLDPGTLSFGVLTSQTATLLGSWHGLAVFFGLITVISLITFASVHLEGLLRYLVTAGLILSLVFLSVINFTLGWWVVGLFALAVFVYSISVGSYGTRGSSLSFSALLVLAFAIIFIGGGENLKNSLGSATGITHVEVRPSWQSTADIARATLGENLFFGSGPGTFTKQWNRNKPVVINESAFWNVDFGSGIGFIPSTIATTGLVGLLAWLGFFATFLYVGFRNLLAKPSDDALAYFLSLSSFLAALYLWIFAILYTPGPVLLALAFILTGLFIASLRVRSMGVVDWHLSFIDNPRLGFIAVLFLTVAFLGSIAGMFGVGRVYAGGWYFNRALLAVNGSGDIGAAESYILRALSFSNADEYHRLNAALNVARINGLASRSDVPPEQLRTEFQTYLATAVAEAQASVAVDAQNYQNWQTLAQVYQTIVPLRIDGAYDNAKKAYDEAIALAPNNPLLYLQYAELELIQGNRDAGEARVTQAIERKRNYTDAIFLLSQIQIDAGKIDEAITSVEAATIIDPTNPVAYFQLGVLRYSKRNFAGVVEAMERAILLSSNYSNARYFLGLAYFELKQPENAIRQFEEIQKLNPDNAEVTSILANLRSGKAPFGGAATTKVEDLPGLPVPESADNAE